MELDLWTCRTVPVHTPTAYGMLARELKLGKTTAASMLGHCLVGERGRGGARTGGERQHSAARGLLVSGGTHHCTRSHPATSLSGVCGAMSYTLHRRESHASIVHRCVVQRCIDRSLHHVLERQAHRSSASRGLARCSSTPSPTALPRLESAGRGLCRSCSRADEGREREWKGRAPATERAAGCTRTDACSCNHPPPPPPSHQAVHITTEREERRETRRSRGERQT